MLSSLFSRLFLSKIDHVVHNDISNGREKNKIPAISNNFRDSAPTDYHYVTEDVEGTPMSVDRSLGVMNSCDCEDDCSSESCACSTTYNSVPCYKDGKLSPDYNLDQPEVIYECNIGCKCKQDCKNRVIQRGPDLRLVLFKTHNRGWGIKTMRTIKKGAFIGVYSGELITSEESCNRLDDTYLFNLSFSKRNNDQQYVCDAKFFGNYTRFINHSCQPNVIGIRSFTVHQDTKFPHIAFFALEKIAAKTELTLNYGDNYWLVKCKRDKQYCLCKNAKCRFTRRTFHETYKKAMERKKKEDAEKSKLLEETTVPEKSELDEENVTSYDGQSCVEQIKAEEKEGEETAPIGNEGDEQLMSEQEQLMSEQEQLMSEQEQVTGTSYNDESELLKNGEDEENATFYDVEHELGVSEQEVELSDAEELSESAEYEFEIESDRDSQQEKQQIEDIREQIACALDSMEDLSGIYDISDSYSNQSI